LSDTFSRYRNIRNHSSAAMPDRSMLAVVLKTFADPPVFPVSFLPFVPSTNWPAVVLSAPPLHPDSNVSIDVWRSIQRRLTRLFPFRSTTSVVASRAMPSKIWLPNSPDSNQAIEMAPDVVSVRLSR
jgi:hypothetical protein